MMFGVRRTADFLIKSTQILAGAFIVLALVINIFFLPRVTGSVESVIQSGSTAAPTPTVPQLPPTGAPAQQEVPSGSPTPSK
jgi:preprotein translocase subunit SecG